MQSITEQIKEKEIQREQMISRMNYFYAMGDNEKRKLQENEKEVNLLQKQLNHELREISKNESGQSA